MALDISGFLEYMKLTIEGFRNPSEKNLIKIEKIYKL